MNLKTVNEIFGYGLFGVGAAKVVFTILLCMQMFTNVNIALNGANGTDYGYYPTLSIIMGGAEMILAVGSIIMIIVNMKKQPAAIPGYLWGIGAILMEWITPSSIFTFVVLVQCGMYMKAGHKIRSKNESYKSEFRPKTSKKMIKNTEWFYGDKHELNGEENTKKQKRMEKLEKELEEWKQLLESGEIDEETYHQETSRLIEKERKRSYERNKIKVKIC